MPTNSMKRQPVLKDLPFYQRRSKLVIVLSSIVFVGAVYSKLFYDILFSPTPNINLEALALERKNKIEQRRQWETKQKSAKSKE